MQNDIKEALDNSRKKVMEAITIFDHAKLEPHTPLQCE